MNAGHRCPGERITVEIVKTAARLLTHAMNYAVPPQDLRIDLARMPAIPASRFIIGKVQERKGDSQETSHPSLPGQRNSFP